MRLCMFLVPLLAASLFGCAAVTVQQTGFPPLAISSAPPPPAPPAPKPVEKIEILKVTIKDLRSAIKD